MRVSPCLRRSPQPRTLQFLFLAIAGGLVLFSTTTATAASFGLLPRSSTDVLVGESVEVDLKLFVSAGEGPGDVSITLDWSNRPAYPYWLGSLALIDVPMVLDSSLSVVFGADCSSSLGLIDGSCGASVVFDQPIMTDTIYDVARFQFLYDWVPNPGYEYCEDVSVAGCEEAGQYALISGSDAQAFGDPIPQANDVEYSTFGMPGVRPIPEPNTALLLGLGLAGLATNLRRRGSS